MESEKAKNLAERIAHLLQESENGSVPNDFSFLRASIEKINERLTNIEAKINNQNTTNFIHPSKSHASQEKFEIPVAVAPGLNAHLNEEKACPFEPNGKPCDYCAMCSSRGF